jgi:hypothetical protein
VERINAHSILTEREGRKYVAEACFFVKHRDRLIFCDGANYFHVAILGKSLLSSEYARSYMYTFLMGYIVAKRGQE